MAKVEKPIKINVKRKVYFLPIKSPKRPNINAPNGRITNPTPNAARVAKNAAVGFSFGKNCVAIIGAKLPKI